ncbi:MAG: BTAD domain-containing putative transcriptional regulator [Candidatus Dormibacteria bacterium]
MAEVPERVKTRTQLVEDSLNAALAGQWQEALDHNQAIAERFDMDEETHNRTGKALTELGRLDEALAQYRSTLELNPLNGIAIKQVNRIEELIQQKAAPKAQAAVDVNLFVEEMGKTALAHVELASGFDDALLSPGDQVSLVPQKDTLLVKTTDGTTAGHVEPKLARRVLKFMAGGNEYTAAVANSDDSGVRIIIRETKQVAEFAGVPSFPVRKTQEFRAYAKDSLLRDTEMDDLTGDDDDDPASLEADEDLEGMHPVEPGMEDNDLGDDDSRDENY